jgi:hypothetical protein
MQENELLEGGIFEVYFSIFVRLNKSKKKFRISGINNTFAQTWM